MKVSIITLGCPKNEVDSEHLKRSLLSEGIAVVDDPEPADILMVNTCGFIRDAKEESINEILRLAEMKNRSKRLVVFGCFAKRYRQELLKEIPEIDAIWGVGEDEEILKYCKNLEGNDKNDVFSYEPLNIQASYAYLKIAEGCDKKCTFCVIPSIRGRFRSFSPDEILREAEMYVREGIREIILIAQDITAYGKDLKGYNLVSLLRDLTSMNGDFYIRLLYLYPTGIDDELMEFIATNERIFKYLDIPLQHSEDKLLRLMGRRGTRKDYLRLIRRLRRNIPGLVLRTTLIVGFPTETEEEFNALVNFIEEVGFERLGAFMYSKEDGTPASRLKGQIPERVKQRRYDELMRHQALISLTKNRELIGRKFKAIIDGVDDGVAVARLYSHAPEVDGMVVLINSAEGQKIGSIERKNLINSQSPGFCASKLKAGDTVNVRIVDADEYDLRAILIDSHAEWL